jgi:hypothetical protein
MTSLLEQDIRGVPLLVVLLLAVPATGLLSRRPLRLVGFGGAMVFSLDGAVLAGVLWVGLLALDGSTRPADEVVLGLAGLGALAAGLRRLRGHVPRPPPGVRLCNIAMSAVAGALVRLRGPARPSGRRRRGAGRPDPTAAGLWDLAAVVVGSLAFVAADLLLSALWVARVEQETFRAALADPAGLIGGGTVLAVNAAAVLAALLYVGDPWALLLLAPVAAALVHATKTGTVALTEQARAGALYSAAAGCQQATSREQVLAAVVAAAAEATGAPAVLRLRHRARARRGPGWRTRAPALARGRPRATVATSRTATAPPSPPSLRCASSPWPVSAPWSGSAGSPSTTP